VRFWEWRRFGLGMILFPSKSNLLRVAVSSQQLAVSKTGATRTASGQWLIANG
jgi:hypothetical protein